MDQKMDIARKMKNIKINKEETIDLLAGLGFDRKDAFKLVGSFPGTFDGRQFIEWLFAQQSKPAIDKSNLVPAPCLGVIRLDYNYPPAPGDIDHSGSFMYDVFYRMVPGLTFGICQAGPSGPGWTKEVEDNFVEAIKYLESKGVSGITGDCGFMMWFQQLARRHTTKPVFMSSLSHLPTIVCAMGKHELVAVFTANGKTLEPMRDLIKDECNIDPNDKRLVIVGCEDVAGFEAVAAGAKVDTLKVQPGMVKKCRDTIRKHPNIRAILMECTELPPYSDALRAATGLPVFDAITGCDFFIRGRLDNPNVGLNDWQGKWDGQQDVYKFGMNIAAGDVKSIVNQDAIGVSAVAGSGGGHTDARKFQVAGNEEAAHIPEYLKKDTTTLGVLRLDYDYKPVPGDVDHPSTFPYPTFYRVVPGLTYQMCRDDNMTPEVKEQWKQAVKYLDDSGVNGITCDCSLAAHFQRMTREYTKKPVFLTAAVQLPAIVSGFAKTERILIITDNLDNFRKLMPLIRDELDMEPGEKRFIVAHCWDLPGYQTYLTGDKSGVEDIATHIVKMVKDKMDEFPGIRAVLMESSALCPFTDHIKCASDAPVFDILSACDLFMNGSMDNPLFGMNGWQKEWNHETESYTLGQNLTQDQRDKMNSKNPQHKVG